MSSWQRSGAFKVNTEVTIGREHQPSTKPHLHTVDKEMAFKRLEVDVLQTDFIESSLLIMNSKDLMVTTDRLNLHTKTNKLHVPASGPIVLNDTLAVHDHSVHVNGSLQVDNDFKIGTLKTKVRRLDLTPRQILSRGDYKHTNTFVINCADTKSKGEIVLLPYETYTSVWSPNKIDYLYSITFTVNAHTDALVDVDLSLSGQDLNIKLHSRYSSVTLLWVPEGKWLIQSLGYKTTLIEEQ